MTEEQNCCRGAREGKELAEIPFPIKIKFSLLCFCPASSTRCSGLGRPYSQRDIQVSISASSLIQSFPSSSAFQHPFRPSASCVPATLGQKTTRVALWSAPGGGGWWCWPVVTAASQWPTTRGGCVIITKIIKTIESLIEIYFPLSSVHSIPSHPCILQIDTM